MYSWQHARWYPLVALLLCTVLLTGSLLEVRQTYPNQEQSPSAFAPQDPLFIPPLQTNPDAAKPQPELPDNPVDFAALQEEFPEAVGWITLPNTRIDYAVMQSGPDTPEDFYLNHSENGDKSRYGSIYIQRYNQADFSDPNTVIYGHNMGNGSMFADLHKFKKSSFFEENQYLYVYTPGHELVYRIYAVFSYEERNPSSGNIKHLLWAYDFSTDEGYQTFIDKTLNPKTRIQQVRKGVTPTTADRVITLSTCIDGSSNSGRLLLVAVLEQDTKTK